MIAILAGAWRSLARPTVRTPITNGLIFGMPDDTARRSMFTLGFADAERHFGARA